jgi:DNA-binding beta-propeller fold protein YncE
MRRALRVVRTIALVAGASLIAAGTVTAKTLDRAADAVLGQPDFNSSRCGIFCGATGVAVDPSSGRLYVSDFVNNRVVSWRVAWQSRTGEPPDLVIGQPDLDHTDCNLGAPAADSRGLCTPDGITVDQHGTLYVADTGNNRVLAYRRPLHNEPAADLVIGQPNFSRTTGACFSATPPVSITGLCGPEGISVGDDGTLYVVDTFNDRVLRYSHPQHNGQPADLVLGQADFTAFGCNRNPSGPSPASALALCEPGGIAMDGHGALWVADVLNNRVLRYSHPATNGQAADLVLGKPDFTTHDDADCSTLEGGHANAAGLCEPTGLAIDRFGSVVVADRLNNRIVVFRPPQTNHESASVVLGQSSFTTGTCDRTRINASSLCGPFGVAVDRLGNVYVADIDDNRVLRYDLPSIPRIQAARN